MALPSESRGRRQRRAGHYLVCRPGGENNSRRLVSMAASCLGRGSCSSWRSAGSCGRCHFPGFSSQSCCSTSALRARKDKLKRRISFQIMPSSSEAYFHVGAGLNPQKTVGCSEFVIAFPSIFCSDPTDNTFCHEQSSRAFREAVGFVSTKIASIFNGRVISRVSYLPSIIVLFWAEYSLGWSAGLPLLRSWIRCLDT